jgi:hypothetical protein
MSHTLTITPDGTVRCLYDDTLQPLLTRLGTPNISRASHVEPTADGQWEADMRPVAPGVLLGPFRLRTEALTAERDWLLQHLFHVPFISREN